MPRKKKDDPTISSRHIRRLVHQRTEQDLKDIKAQIDLSKNLTKSESSSYNDDLGDSESDASKERLLPIEGTSQLQDLTENSDVIFEECNFGVNVGDMAGEMGYHEVFPKSDVDNEVINIDIDPDDSNDGMSDTDDCSSDISNIYRYSDSEVDSIFTDDDVEIDFDFDDALRNLTESRDEKFRKEITIWAIDNDIKQKPLKGLLIILNNYTNTVFCKDPRTLLKTPKETNVVAMEGGQYCHIGLKNCLKKIILNRLALNQKVDTLNLLIFIDGAPLGKSSEKGLWVILFKDTELDSVHLVGVYCGAKKPEDQNNFLKYFVEEAIDLINNGYSHNQKLYTIKICGFICDAPAKAFVLSTKYHSGYHSCSKCLIEGEYYSSVCFPVANIKRLQRYCESDLRTDLKFKNLEYLGDYQRGDTILNQLPHVGLVTNVPLDSMHLVYLGVMKQLIKLWIGDKKQKKNHSNYPINKSKKFQVD